MTTTLFSKLRKSRTFKGISMFMACSFLGQMLQPSVAMALNGGPSQPEAMQFQQAGVSNLVDPFTGDMSYNIPLLTVPGPNGGYPINIGYASGIGMEQESSWVGLGWNINPGAVNRSLRGLPDDFKGDVITKQRNMKPNVTVGFGGSLKKSSNPLSLDKETLGFEFGIGNVSTNLYYNNYKGIGYNIGLGTKAFLPTKTQSNSQKQLANKSGLFGNFSLSLDSQKGLGFSPSISYGNRMLNKTQKFNLGTSFSSRQGLSKISLTYDSYKHEERSSSIWGGAGTTFSKVSYVPGQTFPMSTTTVDLAIENGVTGPTLGKWEPSAGSINASVTVTKLKTQEKQYYGYGFFYSDERPNEKDVLMDFNRENDRAVTKRNQTTATPIQTNDIFSINGQGTGGIFQAHRSDIGIYKDETVYSKSRGGNLGLEFGQGSDIKFGINAAINYGESYSGPWRSNFSQLNKYNHIPAPAHNELGADPTYEPFYFKAAGEQTARSTTAMDDLAKDAPVAFGIELDYNDPNSGGGILNNLSNVLSWEPEAQSTYRHTADYSIQNSRRKEREKRIQSIQYRTRQDMVDAEDYSVHPKFLYAAGTNYLNGTPETFDYLNLGQPHHIHEMEVVNPDGTQYTYGLPSYNHKQKDVAFALDDSNRPSQTYESGTTVDFNSGSASVNNTDGKDHFFSSSEVPSYAQSWLLTQIVSQDYVDLTNDGPSADDFGYWTKFNYTKQHTHYKWRVPYQGAKYDKGYFSDKKDDKASYTYGEKEVYYVNSIETKTHIAIFDLGNRADGLGAHSELAQNGQKGNQSLKYLRNITLYSKADLYTPITTVHFQYDYSLCPNVPNNSNAAVTSTDAQWITENQGGKLTLKSVWLTGRDNEKGSKSPYRFAYVSPTTPYQAEQLDRWGNYQQDRPSDKVYNNENPYVNQFEDNIYRDQDASRWNLSQIQLPSGGSINVSYEADDYAYVQDKKATQMFELLGFLKEGESPHIDNISNKLRKRYDRVVFRLNKANSTSADVAACLQGIDEVYFKAWVRLLENEELTDKYDYVSGFATIDKTAGYGILNASNGEYGYFTIERAGYKNKDGSGMDVHPIRKAAWQYIRFQRPDLPMPANALNTVPISPQGIINTYNTVLDFIGFFAGYYNAAALKGYGKRINNSKTTNDYRPSYVRLHNPASRKFGGGNRVAKVEIKDNWIEESATYGITYDYTMPDGTSSGVAEYEPIIGGDENPLKVPIWDDPENKIRTVFSHPEAYTLAPIGEAYYPGAKVGYSRVVIRSTGDPIPAGQDIITASQGVSVNEFYTAKDFPVKTNYSELKRAEFYLPVIIPFVGTQEYKNNGYSQGFTVELNDMHGKPKSAAVYPGNTDFQGNPTSKTTYHYQTESTDPSSLYNTVTVLNEHGKTESAEIGVTHEFFIAEREHADFSVSSGFAFNIQGTAPALVPTGMALLEYSESMFREVTTTKVIRKTGIINAVTNFADGSSTTAQSLVYDAETGGALLTKNINEWNEPVYNYGYAAHWAYDGMEGAYRNYRAKLHLVRLAGNTDYSLQFGQNLQTANIEEYVYPGDEIVYSSGGVNKIAYITSVDPVNDLCELENADGSTLTLSALDATVFRSGYRNMQGVSNGSIVSLNNPINNYTLPVFDEWNNQIFASSPAGSSIEVEASCDPNYYANYTFNTYLQTPTTLVITDNANCHLIITLDAPASTLIDLNLLDYSWSSSSVSFDYQGQVINGTFPPILPGGPTCFELCGPRILHADAVVYSEDANDWNYNYQDVNEPEIEGGIPLSSVTNSVNPYRYGLKGVWRPNRSFAYLVERIQSGTHGDYSRSDISKDGEYRHFQYFDWNSSDPITANPNWQWTNHQTAFSPYGFAVEAENALGIPSTELFGYDHSIVTAVAANANYLEIASDGFEEYPLGLATSTGNGHLNFTTGHFVSQAQAHTGTQSLALVAGNSTIYDQSNLPGYFTPQAGNEYTVSLWVHSNDANSGGVTVSANVGNSTVTLLTLNQTNTTGEEIDGWARLEGNFTLPQGANGVLVQLNSSGSSGLVHFDDIRLQPFQSSMQTYVYDPATLWLVATLDDRNYASFYNYDEEGNLVQVKKETERGIFTVQSHRQNIQQEQ